MMKVPLAIVAAIAENGVIGDGRGLPWHLPSDLRHFRNVTMGKPVLMGPELSNRLAAPCRGARRSCLPVTARLSRPAPAHVTDSSAWRMTSRQRSISLRRGPGHLARKK